jgi:hypothetical protein
MALVTSRAQRRKLLRDSSKLPTGLIELPRHEWPFTLRDTYAALQVWRSRDFLVQVFDAPPPAYVRISVNRTVVVGDRWADGISWEQLQDIKTQVGYGNLDAVEVFPVDLDVVNVANMRHLWVLRERLSFAWRRTKAAAMHDVFAAEEQP